MGAVATENGDAGDVKKGRGRPKKTGSKATAAYVPSGKPRGRPKEEGTVYTPYVPTGKPRGRPKGTGKKQKKAAAGKVTKAKAAPKKKAAESADEAAE